MVAFGGQYNLKLQRSEVPNPSFLSSDKFDI